MKTANKYTVAPHGNNDGYIVFYRDKKGFAIWSEWCESKAEIRDVYQFEISRGRFDGSEND